MTTTFLPMTFLHQHWRRLAAHKEQNRDPDSHDHEADVADIIVTQASDFRHHLTVLLWRDKRQHALDNEHQGNRRKDLSSYCSPSDRLR